MRTLVSPSDLALVWTQSPRDSTPPLRDMFLIMVTDITLMATTMERDPPMLRLRPSQRHSMVIMVTPTVWATTLAMLGTDTLDTPLLTVESPPPTPPSVTPLPILPEVSPTPPTSVSAPTTSVPSSPA